MRYFLISDNIDTQIGLRLSGIEGIIAHTQSEARDAINWAITQPDIALLLVTERLASMCPDLIYDLKLHALRPLLVEIPDRHGTGRSVDSITRYVNDSIGIRVE